MKYFIYVACFFAVMSLILFFVMGADKSKAKRHARRVPERTLVLLAALGGAVGGCLGMLAFRHKTRHLKFLISFPLFAVLDLAILWLLAK